MAPHETLLGTNALSAPIFGAGGVLMGVIAIIDSIQHIEATPAAEQVRQVVAAAAQISQILGLPADRGRLPSLNRVAGGVAGNENATSAVR